MDWYDDFLTSIGVSPGSTTSNFGNNYLSNDDLFKQITGGTDSASPIALITKLLSGTGESGKAGQLAGVAGLYSLINSLGGGLGQTGQGVYKGYQGGIPNYTATRTMNPIPQTVDVPARAAVPATATTPAVSAAPAGTAPRRPGSGGVTYFSPMQYNRPEAVVAPAAPVTTTASHLPADEQGKTWDYGVAAPTESVAAESTGLAAGGIANLGGYSDGGRLLKGPGDGVSDSIPATIGDKQPARLADGEFVIPARIVSEIGNGSTDAGAKKLYAMMDRIQGARKKSIKNVAANTKADKYLPK
jgi:hypothetical protein